MLYIPPGFEELARAFDDPESAAWYVGSAEGRWMTPSEEQPETEVSKGEDEGSANPAPSQRN